jgi:hypothetical protein
MEPQHDLVSFFELEELMLAIIAKLHLGVSLCNGVLCFCPNAASELFEIRWRQVL